EIARRLATMRGDGDVPAGEPGEDEASPANLEYELNWTDNPEAGISFRASEPPDLPAKLSPLQAAQLSELLEYIHLRIRDLLAGVRVAPQNGRITLDERQWQSLIDIQSHLAQYRHDIGEPSDDS